MNAKGTVGSFGGRKLIYNKIITRKRCGGCVCVGGGGCGRPGPPLVSIQLYHDAISTYTNNNTPPPPPSIVFIRRKCIN